MFQTASRSLLSFRRTIVTKVTSETQFSTLLADAAEKKQLLVVDWTASWCGPCKMIAPHFDKLSDSNKDVVFVKADVDELPELANKLNIMSMPTFHFIRDQEMVQELRGADPAELAKLISKHK